MLSKDEIEEVKVGCHARLLFKKAMLRIIDKLFSEQTVRKFVTKDFIHSLTDNWSNIYGALIVHVNLISNF